MSASFRPAAILLALTAASLLLAAGAVASPQVVTPAAATRFSKLPEPITLVPLTAVPHRFEGATVRVAMTIDPAGHAIDVAEVDRLPLDLRGRILPSVAQWRFSPARDLEGRPVSVRVILPLHLVAEASDAE